LEKLNGIFKPTLYGSAIAVIVCGSFGGYQLYQRHHLSSDLKRTLTAAMDSSATEEDVSTYLRDARLQVRTRKDAEILQKFQKAVHLAEDSSQITARLFNETFRSLHSLAAGEPEAYSTVNKLIEIRSQYWAAHKPVPKNLQTQIHQALVDGQARRKQESQEQDEEQKRADNESKTAKRLYNDVRSELGWPPLCDTEHKSVK
jgi:hypothetical protein